MKPYEYLMFVTQALKKNLFLLKEIKPFKVKAVFERMFS